MGKPCEIFYDANMMKWIIETVHEPNFPLSDADGNYIWIHLDGDNESLSGAIGRTFSEAMDELRSGGYFWRE